MSDKMREEFEKWARTECFDLAAVAGFYSDNETDAAWRAWQAARTAPEASLEIFASRCPMCSYQHGHQIGCENNPIDIALRASAAAPKVSA